MDLQTRNAAKAWVAAFFAMFLVSGVSKLLPTDAEHKRLLKKFPFLSEGTSKLIVFAVGLFEVIASVIVVSYFYEPGCVDKATYHFTLQALMLFVVLVTLIFYTRPFKRLPFLANLTTLSGIALLSILSRS